MIRDIGRIEIEEKEGREKIQRIIINVTRLITFNNACLFNNTCLYSDDFVQVRRNQAHGRPVSEPFLII